MITEIENPISNNTETSIENKSRSAEISERISRVTERVSSRIISKEVNSGTWAKSLAESIKSDEEKTSTDSDPSQVRKSRIKSSATYLGAAGIVSGVSTVARYAIGPVGVLMGTLLSASYFARREGRKITEESSKNSSHIQEKYANSKERKILGAGKRYAALVEEKVTPLIDNFYKGLVARETLSNKTTKISRPKNPVIDLTISPYIKILSKFIGTPMFKNSAPNIATEVTSVDIPKLPDDDNALFIGLVTGYKSNNEEEQKMLDKIKEYVKSKPELFEDGNESMKLAIERAVKFTTEARNRIVATQVRRSILAGLIGVGAGVAIGEIAKPILEHSAKLATPIRGHNIQKIVTNHGHNTNIIHSSSHVERNPKFPGTTNGAKKLGNIGNVTLKPGDTVWGILQSKGIQPESHKGLTAIISMFRNNPHFLESAKIIAKNEGAGKTLSMLSNPNIPVSNILKQLTPQQIMHAAHWIPSSGSITL